MSVCVLKSVALISCLVEIPSAKESGLLYVSIFPIPFTLRQKGDQEQEFLLPFAAAVLGVERRWF